MSNKDDIILESVSEFNPEDDTIFNLLSTNISLKITSELNKGRIRITTQDMYDTFSECFDHYNAFVREKGMDLPSLEQKHYDMLIDIINDIVKKIECMDGD